MQEVEASSNCKVQWVPKHLKSLIAIARKDNIVCPDGANVVHEKSLIATVRRDNIICLDGAKFV